MFTCLAFFQSCFLTKWNDLDFVKFLAVPHVIIDGETIKKKGFVHKEKKNGTFPWSIY